MTIVWILLVAYVVGLLFVVGLGVAADRGDRESRAVFHRWNAEARPPRRRPASTGGASAA